MATFTLNTTTLLADGPVELQYRKTITDGDEVIDLGFFRQTLAPGADLAAVSNLPADAAAAIAAYWTPERVAAWIAAQEAAQQAAAAAPEEAEPGA